MEKTEVQEISPIETALAKENITNQVIEKLKTDYLGLKINGLDDKKGFKAVEDARKHCKEVRVLASKICKAGREYAIKTQKEWIAKEKEVISAIDITECYLEAQSNAIKEEEKRILFEAAQKSKLSARKEKLATIGVSVEDDELLKINDEQFISLFNDLHSQELAKKEAALKEEKRLADEKVEKERKRIEAEEKEQAAKDLAILKAAIVAKELALKTEQEKAAKEKAAQDKIIADNERKAKEEKAKQDAIIAENKAKAEAELAKQKAIADAKLKEANDAKIKAENELKAKAKADANAIADAELAKESELSKGDKEKMDGLVKDLDALKTKYTFKSKKHNAIYSSVCELLDKTISYAISKS